MSEGSTPTAPPRHRHDGTPSALSRAECGRPGAHTAVVSPGDVVGCPACWPASYASQHARHRTYLTTEARAVTR